MYQTIGLKLITNHGEYLINVHPTLEQCAKYYMLELRNGRAIKDIVFKVIPYSPLSVKDAIYGKVNHNTIQLPAGN